MTKSKKPLISYEISDEIRLQALRVQGYNLIIPQTYSYCANKSLQTCGALTSSK